MTVITGGHLERVGRLWLYLTDTHDDRLLGWSHWPDQTLKIYELVLETARICPVCNQRPTGQLLLEGRPQAVTGYDHWSNFKETKLRRKRALSLYSGYKTEEDKNASRREEN
ncbi:hypothetical protein PoB_007100400 [Plakobranchus ocellatus]|uniref:Uncharacterized protein n=1 Tax=Plakobranchus ocellatus TaxID=259542 RepID=A0AAV4DJY0_9GAST|nr:hypothetical protein PoB_007100400 [Plakobranchus ocellatus]